MPSLIGAFTGIGVPPSITGITGSSGRVIRVDFSEYMTGSLGTPGYYTITPTAGSRALNVVSASAENLVNPTYVILTFDNEMTLGVSNYTLSVSSLVIDLNDSSSLSPSSASFNGFGAPPYIQNISVNTTSSISFLITDVDDTVLSSSLSATITQGLESPRNAIITGSFVAPYSASSSRTPSGNGYQINLVFTGSWNYPVVLNISGRDNSFNGFTSSYSFYSCDDSVFLPTETIQIPQAETLVLHWNFENVTGSGDSSDSLPTTSDAKFIVQDISSGSLLLTSSYSWLGPIKYHQYPGQGDFYLQFDENAVQKEYVPSAKQLLPEVLNSSNLVEIRTQDDDLFTKQSRPIKHFYSIEKSPYAIISDEMMKLFSTITDFNNLIGEPVNRYRQNYKQLEKLRNLYFKRINNETIDFEKFADYFKWFDSSIAKMLEQLIPASANFSSDIRNIVESHILERNKYWNKFPTLEFKKGVLEGGLKSINELLYNYKTGSAPIPLIQSSNPYWWKNRAERTGLNSSGNSNVDFSRTMILSSSLNALNRSFSTPLNLVIENENFLTGGVRPVRILNIKNNVANKFISASVFNAHVPLGNYNKDYEIIQTSGRLNNNKFLIRNNGTATINLDSPINGVSQFTLQDRTGSINQYIFVERFSSPGESRTMSRGHLDQLAEEYSVYNDLNYRNLTVRENLKTSASIHTDLYGYNSNNTILANYHKINRNINRRIEQSGNVFITASNYDNQFVQKVIPQSDLQYQWISSSLDSINNTVLGFISNFTIPYGTSSLVPNQIAFISGSNIFVNNLFVNFAGLNSLIYDSLTSSANILSASNNIYNNNILGTINNSDVLNALLNHRNGPYQYPSWKQIRTGNHPVARNHKLNNILSLINENKERVFNTSLGKIVYKDKRGDSFTNYIEPPVSFKNKPLIHTFDVSGSVNPISIRHTYANNLAKFSNVEINNKISTKCDDQMYDRLKDFYISTDLKNSENPIQGFINLNYNEVIFPKDKNTGLSKVRGRKNYEEESSLTTSSLFYNFYDVSQGLISTQLASGNYSHNGIDRNPIDRRTFWKRTAKDRNRFGGIKTSDISDPTSLYDSGSVVTPLINSMGYFDGQSTSIWPFGMTLGHTQSNEGVSDGSSIMQIYNDQDFGELAPMRGHIAVGYTNFNGGGNAEQTNLADWSYWQNGNNARFGSASAGERKYYFNHPTCSALYTKQVFPDHTIFRRKHAENVNNSGTGSNVIFGFPTLQDDFNHRFRVPVFAGKDPWFNSYEEYSSDIKSMAKNYSIIPEFNISKNMNFYILNQGGNFKKQNDKFLTNVGASITQSANDEINGFNEEFFVTYAHSDVMKYLDVILNDHDNIDIGINKISIKCKGIKKLLPYNGFYPVSRTLQLATLFSQSYAPYIGGYKWQNGRPTDTGSAEGGNLSGTFAVASMMQPFFAPGILYNTIKSGIAVDFPVFTGSAAQPGSGSGASSVSITAPTNYRIQFETLVDIKNGSGMGGVPISASDGSKRIYWQGSEYLTAQAATESANRRDLYFDWNGEKTSPLYELASHNFLAETINFFLEDNNLKTIKSKPSNKVKSMISGNTYYMDVRLARSNDLLMYGGRWNNVNKLIHSATTAGQDGNYIVPEYAGLTYTGKFYGHPFHWINSTTWQNGILAPHIGDNDGTNSHIRTIIYADGAYAPYLPPYYFKDAISRISYTSDGTEKNQSDPISYVLSKVKVENFNSNLLNLLTFYNTGSEISARNTPSWKSQMTLSSSLNLFGISKGFKTTYNPNTITTTRQAAINTIEEADASFNSWVISPKFECPILNFKNQPEELYKIVHNDGDVQGAGTSGSISGTALPIPKGMWSGYGEFCSGSAGLFLSIEESFPDLNSDQRIITGSLVDVFGFDTKPQNLGNIANSKEISEAVVAIPFVDNVSNGTTHALTTKVMGRNFFAISKNIFNAQKTRKMSGESAVRLNEFGTNIEIQNTSITNLIENMDKYIIPPELNFLKYEEIDPFVMYIFEFKHLLDKQDLADIWQGVMPKIAMTAEKDEIEISHDMQPWEFFEGKKIPSNIRWMIFKIKKKAAVNYFEKTADSKDDDRFKFEFKGGIKSPDYSYNWPYDYFSLVELAQLEASVDISPIKKPEPSVGEKISSKPKIEKDIFGKSKL